MLRNDGEIIPWIVGMHGRLTPCKLVCFTCFTSKWPSWLSHFISVVIMTAIHKATCSRKCKIDWFKGYPTTPFTSTTIINLNFNIWLHYIGFFHLSAWPEEKDHNASEWPQLMAPEVSVWRCGGVPQRPRFAANLWWVRPVASENHQEVTSP